MYFNIFQNKGIDDWCEMLVQNSKLQTTMRDQGHIHLPGVLSPKNCNWLTFYNSWCRQADNK